MLQICHVIAGNLQQVCTLAGHSAAVRSLAYTTAPPHLLLSGSEDQTVRMWHTISSAAASRDKLADATSPAESSATPSVSSSPMPAAGAPSSPPYHEHSAAAEQDSALRQPLDIVSTAQPLDAVSPMHAQRGDQAGVHAVVDASALENVPAGSFQRGAKPATAAVSNIAPPTAEELVLSLPAGTAAAAAVQSAGPSSFQEENTQQMAGAAASAQHAVATADQISPSGSTDESGSALCVFPGSSAVETAVPAAPASVSTDESAPLAPALQSSPVLPSRAAAAHAPESQPARTSAPAGVSGGASKKKRLPGIPLAGSSSLLPPQDIKHGLEVGALTAPGHQCMCSQTCKATSAFSLIVCLGL